MRRVRIRKENLKKARRCGDVQLGEPPSVLKSLVEGAPGWSGAGGVQHGVNHVEEALEHGGDGVGGIEVAVADDGDVVEEGTSDGEAGDAAVGEAGEGEEATGAAAGDRVLGGVGVGGGLAWGLARGEIEGGGEGAEAEGDSGEKSSGTHDGLEKNVWGPGSATVTGGDWVVNGARRGLWESRCECRGL